MSSNLPHMATAVASTRKDRRNRMLTSDQRLHRRASNRLRADTHMLKYRGLTTRDSHVQQPPEAEEKRPQTPRTKPGTHKALTLLYLNLSLHP